MSPTTARERIDAVDILRGMALFGIVAANMRGFDGPAQAYFSIDALFKDAVSRVTMILTFMFIQGRFVTLFGMLFGLGFAIQMQRAEQKGGSIGFYPRRLLILLGIGIVHAYLIWWGDILIDYAIAGLLLIAFRNCKPKTVLLWAIGITFISFLPLRMWIAQAMHLPRFDPKVMQAGMQHAIQVYRDGSYWARVQMNFESWFFFNRIPLTPFIFVLPRFLVGLWVWKIGLIQNLAAHAGTLRKTWKWALAVGLISDGAIMLCEAVLGPRKLAPGVVIGVTEGIAQNVSAFGLAICYGCWILLATQSEKWLPRVRPFGAVGRMALTNYLMQSLTCTWFFRLTHAYGAVPPLVGFIPVFLLYGAQIPFSVWWLKNYRFGPTEWVWRCLTYGRWQPMRRMSEPEAPIPAIAPA